MGMTIAESGGGDKGYGPLGKWTFPTRYAGLLIALTVLLSSSAAFGLGMLAAKENAAQGAGKDDGFWIEKLAPENLPAAVSVPVSNTTQKPPESPKETPAQSPVSLGTYVASKTGTKYYLPTCSAAKRIKEENRIWFATKADAEQAGYSAASSCKGM